MIYRQARFMYDKKLSSSEKIFLNEIFQTNIYNGGMPVNDYQMAELFNVSTRQVRHWRESLKERNYIYTRKRNGKEYIYVNFNLPDQAQDMLPFSVIYETKEGKKITSRSEAYEYFSNVIQNRNLPTRNFTAILYSFYNTLSYLMFDEQYQQLNISGILVGKNFYQFVLYGVTPDSVFDLARRIFKMYYTNIKNTQLYTLTALVKEFKDEYLIYLQKLNKESSYA